MDIIRNMDYFQEAYGASRYDLWDRLAEGVDERSAQGQSWRGERVQAKVGAWTVTLDADMVRDRDASAISTRLRAPYVNRDGFRFHVSPEGVLSRIGKLMGMQDIITGDDEFDRRFLVKGTCDEKVQLFLRNGRIREVLLELGDPVLAVKDDEGWFGEDFPDGVDELYLEVPRFLTDPADLKELFDFFAVCLHQLCHIGSAYPDDPGLRLV